jgi:hypothetical protein
MTHLESRADSTQPQLGTGSSLLTLLLTLVIINYHFEMAQQYDVYSQGTVVQYQIIHHSSVTLHQHTNQPNM